MSELSEGQAAMATGGSDNFRAAIGELGDVTDAFGVLTVDVASEAWHDTATAARERPGIRAEYFDWLSAYDDIDAGIAVVVNLWSLRHRRGLLLRTRVAREPGSLATLTDIWAGASWHERETFEMFGVSFDGHPNLVPLLLPDGFEGHPLRKEFVLASRVAKAWPGAKEPGESDHDARPARRKMQPPGVPDPDLWGPDARPAEVEA